MIQCILSTISSYIMIETMTNQSGFVVKIVVLPDKFSLIDRVAENFSDLLTNEQFNWQIKNKKKNENIKSTVIILGFHNLPCWSL